MKVVAADVEEPTLAETVERITRSGGEAVAVPTDVSVLRSRSNGWPTRPGIASAA